ncbi:MAG: DUF4139 domain-containing protein [Candidatus Acidiferrum sp.]
MNIDFTTAQLNDVLKSLTVLDLGKGRITGISYNSTAPLERRLGALRFSVGEDPTAAQFLQALRGARLEIQNGAMTVAGRLLSVDQQEVPQKGDQKINVSQISIVSDSGEVRVFDLNASIRVRIAEKDVKDEVSKYLGMVASTRDADVRRMAIATSGEGERDLLVSYISEVPVWKCTYRIVVPKEGKPLLQGWAIVDNTVGEDWNNVELSLVAGAPQSFIQELSQPYYTRRPVAPLPENAMLTPQTHEAALEEKEFAAPSVGGALSGAVGGVMGGVSGSLGPGSGGGMGSGTFAAGGGSSPPPQMDATIVAESLQNGTTVAQAQELGDLFQYKLRDRVTIRKNQSALVPILQTRIDAEKVSVWNPRERSVLRALWIDNTSSTTLDGGTFNVLESEAFAGEGLLDPIKPGEKRLLSYAADLGVLIDAKEKAQTDNVTRIVIAHGAMTQSTEERTERTYTVRNRDTLPRTVVIEHPVREGWKLLGDMMPTEISASYYRFRMNVDPQKTTALTIKEYRPISRRYVLSQVTGKDIELFVSQRGINGEVEKALQRIVAQKNNIAALDAEAASRKIQNINISEDQQRLRENMKALKGSPEEKALVERYARELSEQEDRVQFLRRETLELQQRRDAAQKSLNEMVESLQVETTL